VHEEVRVVYDNWSGQVLTFCAWRMALLRRWLLQVTMLSSCCHENTGETTVASILPMRNGLQPLN